MASRWRPPLPCATRVALRTVRPMPQCRRSRMARGASSPARRAATAQIAILAWGSMLHPALAAAEKLDATVANMRFVKPLDEALVRELATTHDLLVTVEEASVPGSAGGAVTEFLTAAGLGNRVLLLGLPDRFIDQGDPAILLASAGLDAAGIERNIRAAMQSHGGEDGRQVAA